MSHHNNNTNTATLTPAPNTRRAKQLAFQETVKKGAKPIVDRIAEKRDTVGIAKALEEEGRALKWRIEREKDHQKRQFLTHVRTHLTSHFGHSFSRWAV